MFFRKVLFLLFSVLVLTSCNISSELEGTKNNEEVTALTEVTNTDNFREGALEHILEGELNKRGQAVGFHYDRLPTKKGKIIAGTESKPNKHGVFEAEVKVENVLKTSNKGRSTFFPNDWDTQEVVDAINQAYENKEYISGNTYDGLSDKGVHIRMYIDNNDKIISAFPIY